MGSGSLQATVPVLVLLLALLTLYTCNSDHCSVSDSIEGQGVDVTNSSRLSGVESRLLSTVHVDGKTATLRFDACVKACCARSECNIATLNGNAKGSKDKGCYLVKCSPVEKCRWEKLRGFQSGKIKRKKKKNQTATESTTIPSTSTVTKSTLTKSYKKTTASNSKNVLNSTSKTDKSHMPTPQSKATVSVTTTAKDKTSTKASTRNVTPGKSLKTMSPSTDKLLLTTTSTTSLSRKHPDVEQVVNKSVSVSTHSPVLSAGPPTGEDKAGAVKAAVQPIPTTPTHTARTTTHIAPTATTKQTPIPTELDKSGTVKAKVKPLPLKNSKVTPSYLRTTKKQKEGSKSTSTISTKNIIIKTSTSSPKYTNAEKLKQTPSRIHNVKTLVTTKISVGTSRPIIETHSSAATTKKVATTEEKMTTAKGRVITAQNHSEVLSTLTPWPQTTNKPNITHPDKSPLKGHTRNNTMEVTLTTFSPTTFVNGSVSSLWAPAATLSQPTVLSLVMALVFGTVFLFTVIVFVGKRCYDGWQRRHYQKIDYLINGMYN